MPFVFPSSCSPKLFVAASVAVAAALASAASALSVPDGGVNHLQDSQEGLYNPYKRAAFVGMRGKKSLEEDPASQLEMMLARENAKRAAFVGMRGKKAHYGGEEAMAIPEDRDLLEYILNRWGIAELGKRAGFVGMRGRRGSFVGMRGKKSLEDTSSSSGEGEVLPWKRGGNSGFVGMRG